eukprot:TRINITY_DN1889_c0_g2_i1.p2 TRINITY_DN1889_c0_g2~~TRINITY_DN1889_c0_g2_i1.p2  ORF type:complete len:106 (-),score=13.02 TRINITY_DN1889_c0_g2_i1:64-381(-)
MTFVWRENAVMEYQARPALELPEIVDLRQDAESLYDDAPWNTSAARLRAISCGAAAERDPEVRHEQLACVVGWRSRALSRRPCLCSGSRRSLQPIWSTMHWLSVP